MLIKRVGLLIAIALSEISSVAHAAESFKREPISAPYAVGRKGATADLYLNVRSTQVYTISLDLITANLSNADSMRVGHLWGGNGGYSSQTGLPIPVGIPIPLQLTISKIDNESPRKIFDSIIRQEANWAGSNAVLSKLIEKVELSPGNYQITIRGLEEVKELVGVPGALRVLVENK